MITLPGVSWLSNSTDRILTPIFTSLFYLPCLLSGARYGPVPSSLASNQPWCLGVTKYSRRVAFKALKSESNLWLGTLFASWIFMSALLFFGGISELIRRADFILRSEVPTAAVRLHIRGARCSQPRLCSGSCFVTLFLSWCRFYQTDQRQIYVSQWNIKTRLWSAFSVARRRLLLLTASQRESEEMIKTGFYFTPGFLSDFHFNVAMMAALWLMLFVSFILLHRGEHQHCNHPGPQRLDLVQITHLSLFFFCGGGLQKCIWPPEPHSKRSPPFWGNYRRVH